MLANAIAAFRHAPEWGGVLAFNEFGCGTVVLKPAPWGVVPKAEWTDHEDRLAAEWLQRQGVLDHGSLNIDTFDPIYVLMGHALPEEAPARPVQRGGDTQAGVHPQVSN